MRYVRLYVHYYDTFHFLTQTKIILLRYKAARRTMNISFLSLLTRD
jgi:hypothetical protein